MTPQEAELQVLKLQKNKCKIEEMKRTAKFSEQKDFFNKQINRINLEIENLISIIKSFEQPK